MDRVRGELGQRREREPTSGQLGMGNHELGRLDDRISVQQQIEVDLARAPATSVLATAEVSLDLLQLCQ